MVQPKTIEVNGRKYQVILHTGFNAIQLDRKVAGVAFRSFGALGSLRKADGLKGLMPLIGGLAKSLQELSDSEYLELVSLTFGQTVALVDGKKDIPMVGEAIGEHFQGRMVDFYTCMFKVWEVNELSPFGLLEQFGSQITPTQP